MNNQNINRLDYIDRFRGIAIILVVMGHIIQYNIINGQNTSLYSIIYSFHMPLFFFISGYVLQKFFNVTTLRDSILFIWKKAGALLLPLVAWGVIRTIYINPIDFMLLSKVYYSIANQIMHPQLWFLHTLFLLMLFYVVFHWTGFFLNHKKHFLLDVLIYLFLMSLTATLYKLFSHTLPMSFLLYSIFMMFSIFTMKYQKILELIENNIITTITFILFLFLLGSYNFNESDLLIMKVLKIIISFTAITLLYKLSKQIIFSKTVDNFIIQAGKSSLAIYVIHFSFVAIALVTFNVNLFVLFTASLAISIVIILAIFYIEKIIKVFPYISMVLLDTSLKSTLTTRNIDISKTLQQEKR
jgi:fucose 4-O-acetylase-like acetyltransferase